MDQEYLFQLFDGNPTNQDKYRRKGTVILYKARKIH